MSDEEEEDNEEYAILGELVSKCPQLCAKFQEQLDCLSEAEQTFLQDEIVNLAEITDSRRAAFFRDLSRSAVKMVLTNNAGETVTVLGANYAEQE